MFSDDLLFHIIIILTCSIMNFLSSYNFHEGKNNFDLNSEKSALLCDETNLFSFFEKKIKSTS